MRSIVSLSAVACALLLPIAPHQQGKLRQDARVGAIADLQGTAVVRPVGRERWTPLGAGDLLMPGDQVRTPVRGANAAEIRLEGGGGLVLGPGALVEIPERGTVRLYRGDLEISGGKRPVRVTGVGAFDRRVAETAVLRGTERSVEELKHKPRWLVGYRASTSDEWMGSLVAQVDGRDVPLSVGYHKVTVDIRDQVAATTVEQSFVNSTRSTLEGVFYFPLPADASISGFGMWIGNELVEADIVEKQRARAIYEDILRRRKDPGLLEWSGGNLFKARVFPIFPHSEKRIRIRYTQVLPMQGGKLRYRYALRSELLRQRPLRDLQLKVNVSSAMPIADVSSPTHSARIRKTAHAASAEFDAQEYSPERDFELAVDLQASAPLTVIPHRRDDDGYFMLLLSPPDTAAGSWERELLPENGPLDLLLIADTSGSMDPAARTAQARFLESMLSLLSPNDSFRLMTCDVRAEWIQEDAAPVTEDRVETALAALDERASLGWTDLDAALDVATETAQKGTIVVYVGDGIGTTGDADPVALAGRLRSLTDGDAVFHAVSTGSTYEKVVLEAIASLGGGSVRAVGDDPARTAYRLLGEVAQPSVKDLSVQFEGLRTARVYPERLPNLPAGTQQVVLGRFLPTKGRQRGKVVVTGTLGGERVRYRADLELAENEQGNSFLPRLWARRHIDALLEEGRSAAVAEEIVAFSEEFGVMTPYTSFLVLENDADRQRYGVQRRVKMRDGEAFFATGRDRAATELLAQQMQRARSWRLGLRARMLRELSTLGVHLHSTAVAWEQNERYRSQHGGGGKGAFVGDSIGGAMPDDSAFDEGRADHEEKEAGADGYEADPEAVEEDLQTPMGERENRPAEEPSVQGPASVERLAMRKSIARSPAAPGKDFDIGGRFERAQQFAQSRLRDRRWGNQTFAAYRFPSLAPAPKLPDEVAAPDWPAEIATLLRGLDRRPALKSLHGGIEISMTGGMRDPRRGHFTSRDRAEGLLSADGWFVRSSGRGREPVLQWLHDDRRGVIVLGTGLGRVRDGKATDHGAWPFPLRDHSLSDLVGGYAEYRATLETGEGDTVVVVLQSRGKQSYELRLTIDRRKSVVLQSQTLSEGKVQNTTRYGGFVEAGGTWWATEIVGLDDRDRTVHEYRLQVRHVDGDAAEVALTAAVAAHRDAILVAAGDPEVEASKQAVAERRADFAEHFTIALHFASSGQWDRAFSAWDEAEKLVQDRPGALWLRAALLAQSRRGEELKKLIGELAARVGERGDIATTFLANHLVTLAGSVYQANEVVELLDRLRPALEQQGDDAQWHRLTFQRLQARWLQSSGRQDLARGLYREIAAARPFDLQAVTDHLNALQQVGDRQQAIRFVERVLQNEEWERYAQEQLYQRWTQYLWERREMRKLLEVLEAWVALAPHHETAYQRWLSILQLVDRQDDADTWVSQRLNAEVTADAAARAQLGAAIQFALGHGWNYWNNRVDEKWYAPLAATAQRLIRGNDSSWHMASRVMNDGRFQRTDECAELRKALLGDLTAPGAIAAMSMMRLSGYLQWIPWGRTQVEPDTWRSVTDAVHARWQSTDDVNQRTALAGHVLRLLDAHGEQKEAIAFLREDLAATADDRRPQVARQLLTRLLQRDWQEALEDEIVALLAALQPVEAAPNQRAYLAAETVRQVADQLYRMRYQALLGPAAEYEKLSRAVLRRRQAEARQQARRELAIRLGTARDGAAEWFQPWFELERLCLLARLGDDVAEIDGEVRELFFSIQTSNAFLTDVILRERCAFVIAFLATRSKTPESVTAGAIALLDELVSKQVPATDNASVAYATDWQYHLYRLLIALDRPEALAKTLRGWVASFEVESRWRIAYGYLMAETGALEEAIAAFEAVAHRDELGAREYQALADWYLATGKSDERERALIARHRVSPEHQLSNILNQEINRISRRGDGVPEELDPDVLRALQALLQKASHPANYIWQTQSLYNTVKDFRILACLADGVSGHTAEGIYPFLEQVGRVLGNVHEEATCDSLVARIAEQSSTADVDRRALLLLTALVERRASEVLNAPGPHAREGVAALRAASRGTWLPGERRLMASFLASLGRIPDAAFAQEQLRQLADLHRHEEKGTLDRLQIAAFFARTQWGYDRHDVAVDVLVAALNEYREACDGVLPHDARDASETLISWYESRRHFGKAEAFLRAELDVQKAREPKNWLTQRLFRVYVNCLHHDGAVALGRGARLYDQVRAAMVTALFEGGADQTSSLLTTFCSLHETAQNRARVRHAGAELERFAKEQLPELLTYVPGNAQSLVSTVAETLHRLRGARPALAFLIERLEAEPSWYQRVGQSGWNHFGYQLGRWRTEVPTLGDLEPRLLRIVLRELERDLLSMQSRNRSMFQIHNSYFWREKQADFRTVAMRVIEGNQDSPARLLYASQYLWSGLALHDAAIDTLLAAETRSKLREDGKIQLVHWLHELKRWGQSLPLLDALTSTRPDRLDYRTLKIRALHEVGRDPDAIAYLDATEKRFRDHELWTEQTLSTLAYTCLTCAFHERCATYCEEVIPLHQRTQRNRGVGQGTLSSYYGWLAQAYVALGKADLAVDAASAAVVAWGPNHNNRRSALQSLQSVLGKIDDLDGYARRYQTRVAESGMDAPVIRKSIGLVYLSRRKPEPAIVHLRAARDLQPNDDQVHGALIAAYDALRDEEGATLALLDRIRTTPMNLALYPDLGQRLARRGERESAERAWTSLVEAQPNEAESHRLLAQHREQQRRFGDAVVQWRQVVRVRTGEPEGWLSLARAQIGAGDREGAKETLEHVMETTWDQRFGDVRRQAMQILGPLSRPPR